MLNTSLCMFYNTMYSSLSYLFSVSYTCYWVKCSSILKWGKTTDLVGLGPRSWWISKQCSSLNKQWSLEYLVSCIFNKGILKTCSLILGTLSCVLLLFLDPLTVSLLCTWGLGNVNRRLLIRRWKMGNVRDDRAAASICVHFSKFCQHYLCQT